jgi:hypothetical protein
VSRVNELSFLPSNRPHRPSSATQLSSTCCQPNGRARRDAAYRPNGDAGRGLYLNIFTCTSNSRAAEEPRKSGVMAEVSCHPRFLTAGHRPEPSKVD